MHAIADEVVLLINPCLKFGSEYIASDCALLAEYAVGIGAPTVAVILREYIPKAVTEHINPIRDTTKTRIKVPPFSYVKMD